MYFAAAATPVGRDVRFTHPVVQDHREVPRRPGRGPRPRPKFGRVRDDPTHAEATYVLPGVGIRLHEARYEITLRREGLRPTLDFRTAARQDDVGGMGVEVGPEAAAYDAPLPVREVAREVAAESLTDLPPSVGLPESKVPRHVGTMGLSTLLRKPPGTRPA